MKPKFEHRRYGVKEVISLTKSDSTRDVGRLMATVARALANGVTTTWAENRGDYDVEITVTLTEVKTYEPEDES